MVWKQATDCCAGTAAIYGAPDLVKVSQLFSDTDVSDTVTIHENASWTFQSDACGLSAFRLRNPAQTFNYLFNTAAIVASRTVSFPLLTGDDTLVFECHTQTLTAKTFVAPALGTPASGVMTNVTGTAACLTAGNVTTNANLTCDITSVGNAATIVAGIIDCGNVNACACIAYSKLNLATAVLVTDLAAGTDGELITWNACGAAATVCVGCCGQVLISGGVGVAPAFGAAGAADNLGNHTATTCLIMGTNAITFGDDVAAPAACVPYVTHLAAGPVYNAQSCDIHDFKINAVSELTISDTIIDAPTAAFQEACIPISPIGTHTQWIQADAWGTVTTNGAEFAELELATNDIMLQTFNFDTCTSEKIQFWWEPPAEWNAGTITFNTKWTAAGGCACETFIINLSGHSYTNSDAIDTAICGTANCTSDALITVNDMHISGESCAVTICGATKGEAVLLQLARDICDTLSVDAKLIGINITYTTDEATAT